MRSSCKVLSELVTNGERVQPIVGDAIPELVVLGSLRKQDEQASKQHPFDVRAWPLYPLLPLGFCSVEFLTSFNNAQQYGSVSKPFSLQLVFLSLPFPLSDALHPKPLRGAMPQESSQRQTEARTPQ